MSETLSKNAGCPGSRPRALEGPRLHRPRPADGRARRDHREHRAAQGPGGPRHIRRQQAVGHHGLRPRLRRAAALRRAHLRPVRPQAHLRHRSDRLRAGLRTRWCGGEPGPALRLPRAPGRLRCPPRARRPLAARRDVHRRQGARQGVRHLRCHRRWWRRGRPAARRFPHRLAQLALDLLRQHPVRDRRRDRRVLLRPRACRFAQPLLAGHPRCAALHLRSGLAGLRIHPRRVHAAGRTR